MPDPTVPAPRQPDIADVGLDCETIRHKLDDLEGRIALVVPHPRSQTCTRLVAVLRDLVDLLDDTAAGP